MQKDFAQKQKDLNQFQIQNPFFFCKRISNHCITLFEFLLSVVFLLWVFRVFSAWKCPSTKCPYPPTEEANFPSPKISREAIFLGGQFSVSPPQQPIPSLSENLVFLPMVLCLGAILHSPSALVLSTFCLR